MTGVLRTSRRWGELAVQSNHSFLLGASHPEELVREAARLGHAGIALTDFETVGGAVRAHVAARDAVAPDGERIRLAHGARVRLAIVESRAPCDGDAPASPPLELLLYASDRASWGALCRLLSDRLSSEGDRSRQPCTRTVHDLVAMLADHAGGAGLLGVLLPPLVPARAFLEAVEGLAAIMRDRLAVAMRRTDDPGGVVDAERARVLAEALGLQVAAVNDIRMHHVDRRPLLDTLTCIRAGTSMQRAGGLLLPNAERRLRAPEEVFRRYADCPEALETSWRFLERASRFSLDELRYEYPDEIIPAEARAAGWTAMEYLRALTWKGARERYPRGVPQKVARQFEHEFAIISDLGYAPYFLTVHEIVAFARERGILCQGRGAAANSAVCFALGVTAVDPDRVDVLFERFVSRERNEPPDIDIDFEHERREEVIQHIYAKYGRDRAALVCEIISYRGRSAVRDVGKALGIAPDAVERLAKEVDRWGGGGLATRDDITSDAGAQVGAHAGARAEMHAEMHAVHGGAGAGLLTPLPPRAAERMRAAGLEPTAPLVVQYARLVDEILGFPRHRSQHVGGFVISRGPLVETVPIANAAMQDRTIIEWDKDDIDALGMLKIDVLSLGMLTAIRKTIDLVNGDRAAIAAGASSARAPDAPPVRADLRDVSPPAPAPDVLGEPRNDPNARSDPTGPPEPLRFHAIPPEDPSTYDMACKADTIGVFQIESRAQMSMLPRLRPRCFYDLVVEVALVRPGPIQGDMVHPYLRRRNGEEPVEYPDDAIRKVLGKTLGVPLFQEQAMSLAVVAAGFTPGQADELRRAIAAWKRQGNRIAQFGEALESGMLSRGYSRKFAQQVFEQIKGFSGYGFPESHAASFALLVYASAWLKRHHPAAFAASLLNSQPMGFYAPAQILRDARDHGVAVRGVDVHCSLWDSTLERGLDLARDLARDLAPAAVASGSTSSCRRTQQELDEAYIRMRVRKSYLRNSAARGLEHWNAGWLRDADGARDAQACNGDFIRLHSRGRSVLAARGAVPSSAPPAEPRPEPRPEPLCAPSADDTSTAAAPRGDAFHVPSQPAIRLGLRMVRGLDVEDAHRIIEAVARHGAFRRMSDLLEASGASVVALRRLAAADAFLSMGLDRQQASWQILALRDHERPLWSFAESVKEEAIAEKAIKEKAIKEASPPTRDPHEPNLPAVGEISDIAKDFEATGVTLKRHPIACIRERLQRARVVPCGFLRNEERTPAGRILSLVGLVLVRQRPSTAKGIVFMTIEDETGVANLIFRPKVYERLRSQVRHAVAICVRGKVERRDGVTHLLVANARDVTASLAGQHGAAAVASSRDFH